VTGAARRVLVTRPEPGATATAAALDKAGYDPVVLPLTEIRPLPIADGHPRGEFTAVAATSANALRCAPHDLLDCLVGTPLFAVGEATAEAGLEAGFSNVETGPGDAEGLAEIILRRMAAGESLLYLCGRVRTPELERRLTAAGLVVNAAETYETLPVTLSPDQVDGLKSGGAFHAVLVHSAGGASALARFEARPDLAAMFLDTLHICVSSRASVPLAGAARVIIADEPTEAAMIAALTAAA